MPSQAKFYFGGLEGKIREIFGTITRESGCLEQIKLEILDADGIRGTRLNRARTVFEVVVPNGPVQITWDTLASLWLCSFGSIRVAARLFAERRMNVERTQIDEGLKNGLLAFRVAQELTRRPLGSWSDRLPQPSIPEEGDTEEYQVAVIFFGSLGWILRHELAHVALGHQEVQTADRMKEDEFEADAQACRWLKGDRQRDQNRTLGVRPGSTELELENRAIRMGIGLLWVALFEEHAGRGSTDHPEIAARFDRCLKIFDLADDSAAAEILSDVLKAWLDPEGTWIASRDPAVATARAALDEAIYRLQRHLQATEIG